MKRLSSFGNLTRSAALALICSEHLTAASIKLDRSQDESHAGPMLESVCEETDGIVLA